MEGWALLAQPVGTRMEQCALEGLPFMADKHTGAWKNSEKERMEEKTCYGLPATPSPHLSVSLLWEEVRNVGS